MANKVHTKEKVYAANKMEHEAQKVHISLPHPHKKTNKNLPLSYHKCLPNGNYNWMPTIQSDAPLIKKFKNWMYYGSDKVIGKGDIGVYIDEEL